MPGKESSLKALDNLLFTKIFQTFRIAMQPTKLIIAFLAITVICLAGWIMDVSNSVVAVKDTQGKIITTELHVYMIDPARVEKYIETYREKGARNGVFSTLWHFAAKRFHRALNSLFAFNLPDVAANIAEYFKALLWAFEYHTIYCVIFSVIKLAVIALAGGSICRIAALQFAGGEKPGLSEAFRFSKKNFTNFFAAPLVPLGICAFIGIFIILMGLIANIPRVGELIIAISLLLPLLAGALITVLLIGAVAGFNLMFPAIAYDGADCFDAVSRAFNYVYSKPWRMALYTATAVVYGALCYIFVRFFAFMLLWLTRLFLQLGIFVDNANGVNKLDAIWPEPGFMNLPGSSPLATANLCEDTAAFLIWLFISIVTGLVVSFIISFYFSANTIIYAVLRKKVDDTPIEDIHRPSEQNNQDMAAFDISKTPLNDNDEPNHATS